MTIYLIVIPKHLFFSLIIFMVVTSSTLSSLSLSLVYYLIKDDKMSLSRLDLTYLINTTLVYFFHAKHLTWNTLPKKKKKIYAVV
jgi:hypothetical protein